jgi:hypothetical protein
VRHVLADVLRIVGCVICSAVLVLLVPSSAWSDDTASPEPSPSSSPSATSSDEPEPAPGDAGSVSPAPSGEPSPAPASETPAPPVPAETVTVTAEPVPSDVEQTSEGTQADPVIVRLDDPTSALILLTACLSVTCLGLMAVTSMRG